MFFGRQRSTGRETPAKPDPALAHIAEYQALRQEVNNRHTVSYTLIGTELAVFGASMTVVRSTPLIMVLFSVISTLLWFFWLAQTMQIYRIAAYVALRLRPRLSQIYGCEVLEWETFVRRLTAGQRSAEAALFGDGRISGRRPFLSRNRDGVHVSVLFGGATPVFLTATAVTQFHLDSADLGAKAAVLASLLLWLCALKSAVSVMRTTQTISRRILAGTPLAGGSRSH